VCHGDLSAHVARQARPTATDREVVPPVAANACASCHAGRDLLPAAGTHPAVALRSESPRLPAPSAAVRRALEQREHDVGFNWSGLVDFGYRFVRVTGSQARFDTDVDLQDGLRLHNAELRGVGGGDAFASELSLVAHDIGDPRWDVGAHARQDGASGLGATYRRDRFRY